MNPSNRTIEGTHDPQPADSPGAPSILILRPPWGGTCGKRRGWRRRHLQLITQRSGRSHPALQRLHLAVREVGASDCMVSRCPGFPGKTGSEGQWLEPGPFVDRSEANIRLSTHWLSTASGPWPLSSHMLKTRAKPVALFLAQSKCLIICLLL